MEAGAEYGIAPIAPSTIRSVEGGLLSYLSDITREDNPFVLGMGHLVDLDRSSDFIGREALENVRNQGVDRHLVGVEIHGKPLEKPNSGFWHVIESGQEIGHITRCVYSPRLDKNIGFAKVPATRADVGAQLVLGTPFGEMTATVCDTPWFPAQKTIPEGI